MTGVTEAYVDRAFGAMQEVWSDRKAFRKSIWVNADSLGGDVMDK
jgi:hypothetical protein